MDKKTVIAVVLAVIIIIVSMIIQNVLFPPKETLPVTQTETIPVDEVKTDVPLKEEKAEIKTYQGVTPIEDKEVREETYTIDTSVFTVKFSNRGGIIQSIRLKKFENNDGTAVEMILPRESERNPFSLHFGDFNAPPVDVVFNCEESLLGTKITFDKVFNSISGIPFRLIKTYMLYPDEYMIELKITIENSINEYPDLDFEGISYTLGFGPQIGPEFKKLDKRNEFRDYLFYLNGKKKKVKISKDGLAISNDRVTWAAIAGKYFGVIAVPDATPYQITYDTRPIIGLKDQSSIYFSRPVIKSSKNTDVFRFYIGPKKRDVLLRYNDAEKNTIALKDMHFEETISTSVFIGWLATAMKFVLELIYKVIPNYGVAIIVLTILIKALLFPLTHKSFESTSKMQSLQPKLNEIKERLKSNPQKMQQETAALYKREGVNPLGGCLPLLLQMPIFFAFYNLLSTHFELRGAMFIPGWIFDLSSPESVWNFAPLAIPIVGWQNLRLLPLIMVGTTFLQSKLTQSPDSSNKQMKMMAYLMPIMFFFILYEMPSGLVLYWTVQNILTVFQQIVINKRRKKKAADKEGG